MLLLMFRELTYLIIVKTDRMSKLT